MNIIKKNELTNLSLDEISKNITDIRKDIIIMQINKKTKQTIKPHEIKKKKHILSQLLTLETLKKQS
jgi:ribosomal protein L29